MTMIADQLKPLQGASALIERFECAVFTWTRTQPCEQTDNYRAEMDAARAALLAAIPQESAAVAVPDGWQLVPIEPTQAMLQAAAKLGDFCAAHNYGGSPTDEDLYGTMLASAPAPFPASVDAVQSAGEVLAWCQPMEAGKHMPRKFIVRFCDQDINDGVFDDEAEAYDFWQRSDGGGWNCYLFGAMPRQATPSAPSPAAGVDAVQVAVLAEREAIERLLQSRRPYGNPVAWTQYQKAADHALSVAILAIRERPAPCP